MGLARNDKINQIVDFIKQYPESTVSLRISRETMGQAPLEKSLGELTNFRNELETAEDWVIDGYYYLIK